MRAGISSIAGIYERNAHLPGGCIADKGSSTRYNTTHMSRLRDMMGPSSVWRTDVASWRQTRVIHVLGCGRLTRIRVSIAVVKLCLSRPVGDVGTSGLKPRISASD